MIEIKQIVTDTSGDRVSTGPLRINSDWPGVFIRGDEALGYVAALSAAVEMIGTEDTLTVSALDDLAEILKSCHQW